MWRWRGPDGESAEAKLQREINWEAIAAIIAALVGLLAILVSAYTAWSIRQQTRAQVWPDLEVVTSSLLPSVFATSADAASLILGHGGRMMAVNRGVGPAIVRRVEIKVNEKPQRSWNEFKSAMGVRRDIGTSSLNHTVFAPGDERDLFMLPNQKAWTAFKNKLDGNNVSIRICYCSTLGDCWMNTVRYGKAPGTKQPVGSCETIPKKDEFDD